MVTDNKPVKLLLAVVLAALPVMGGAQEDVKCDTGPLTRTFGASEWFVYSCDDGRTLAMVSAPGSPAVPFYFILAPQGSGYRLYGEGTGSKAASAKCASSRTTRTCTRESPRMSGGRRG